MQKIKIWELEKVLLYYALVVQLASAVYGNADLFVTNDDRLSRFEDNRCRVILLSEF